ncbi:hypothetical protein CWATWH0003_2768b6, partial [Crocosphaera watsonii WH 0003]
RGTKKRYFGKTRNQFCCPCNDVP